MFLDFEHFKIPKVNKFREKNEPRMFLSRNSSRRVASSKKRKKWPRSAAKLPDTITLIIATKIQRIVFVGAFLY